MFHWALPGATRVSGGWLEFQECVAVESTLLTASTEQIDEVSRRMDRVGEALRTAGPVESAVCDCPLVPQAAEFLRALGAARGAQADVVGGLGSFFADATSSLANINRQITEHDRSTADSWGKWDT